jgi:hypothetical protein
MKCSDPKYIALPPEDGARYTLDFTEFEPIPTKTDYTLIAIGSHPDVYKLYDRIVMLWYELPNCLVHTDPSNLGHYSQITDLGDKFIKLIINCPFSVDYFNQMFNYDKCVWGFFPVKNKYIPAPQEKIFDVFYSGGLIDCPVSNAFPVMQEFKHCIVSFNGGTHQGVGYQEKLKLNAQSKISICHGLLSFSDRYKRCVDYHPHHPALELVKQYGIAPQMKIRTFEAAMCKSIILSLHDPWNMIESFLEPGKDFIYWYDEKDLKEKITHILANYDDYIPMIEHAYNTVVNNYTTKHFFETYLKDL